jgi:hypothetical protein
MPRPELLLPEIDTDEDPAAAHAAFLDRFAPVEKKSALESVARGGFQGLTAGYGDEITGALESAFTPGKTYREARDEARANNAAAKKDNPLSYGGGNIAGSLAGILIPGGAIVKGAGLGANVVRGAAYGAAYSTGESETEASEHPLELAKEGLEGAAGGAVAGAAGHVALKGLAAILAPVGRVAGKVAERAGREADTYATERLVAAQGKGEAELGKEAERFAPLLEKEPANRNAAAASPEVATASATKKLTDSALDRLRIETGNKQKIQVFGRRGANEGSIKEVLEGDRELRAAIDVGGEPGVSGGNKAFAPGKGPDAALDVVASRLEADGAKADTIYDTAQQFTPGARPQAVLGGLRDLEADYRRLGATAPLADVVKKEMKRFSAQYKGQKAIPLQELREQYRGWQNLGFSGGAQFSIPAQKQIQRDMGNVMRTALQEEIEAVGGKTPELKALLPELRAINKRISALKGLETLLDEWSTRKAAQAPTMGEMTLSPLKAIRTAVERQAMDAGRAVIGNVAAAGARRGAGGAPSAAMATLMRAARSGKLTAQALRQAAAAGIPADVIERVKAMSGAATP